MYSYDEDELYDSGKETKRITKNLELDTLYKQLEAHMNMVFGCQYILAFAFCCLIWWVDETRSVVMEYPGFLIVSGSLFLLCVVAVRFFFLQVRDAPLNVSALIFFSISKVYLLGFILCVCTYKEYLIGLALLACDFAFAFGISLLTKDKRHWIIADLGFILLEMGCLLFFNSFLVSFLITLVTTIVFVIYQLTILLIVSKKKFGNKDYLISSIFLYALWLIPFSPEEV